ncbi:hypothetical protein EYF80_034743 [Liparis tanakae]|uniref:Uncharacterized protein n=1 Tax=Liparis tanakae TaxID=230148 RepID=A0A4Z2GNA3_9TELE|nr:hypothetical protein EYF80_034743 [Liparis tanakae]
MTRFGSCSAGLLGSGRRKYADVQLEGVWLVGAELKSQGSPPLVMGALPRPHSSLVWVASNQGDAQRRARLKPLMLLVDSLRTQPYSQVGAKWTGGGGGGRPRGVRGRTAEGSSPPRGATDSTGGTSLPAERQSEASDAAARTLVCAASMSNSKLRVARREKEGKGHITAQFYSRCGGKKLR